MRRNRKRLLRRSASGVERKVLLMRCDWILLLRLTWESESKECWLREARLKERDRGCDIASNGFTHHFFLFWFTTLYIYNSLFLSFPPKNLPLSPTSFTNPTPDSFISLFRTALTDLCMDRFFWATRFLFLFFHYFFVFGPCARLNGHSVSFWEHVNQQYRIV